MTKTITEENIENKKMPLVVTNFGKKYQGKKEFTVRKCNFEVGPGEFHGFIGANGAGKTTIIKSLVGAYASFEGSVKVYGSDSSKVDAKKHIGYIPEKANFPNELSCYEYIWRMAYLSGYSKINAQKFAKKKLTELGLAKYLHTSPLKLSSGQKKKVLLAQALAHDPDLIIMDEPAANLDPQARSEFFTTLKELQKKGKSIFMSSHILAELQEFVDAVTILDGGKIMYTGSVAELRENKGLNYIVKFAAQDEWSKFNTLLAKLKLKTKKDEDKRVVSFKTMSNVHKALSFIAKNNLNVEIFATSVQSLQTIYDKFVVNGGKNV